MRTFLTILLFQIAIISHAQKQIAVYAAGNNMVYCTNVANTYNPQAGDTLVIMNKGVNIVSVKLENLCSKSGKPVYVTQQDTSAIGGYGAYAFVANKVANVNFFNLHINGKDISNSCFAMSEFQNVTVEKSVFEHSSAMGVNIKTDYSLTDSVHTKYPYANKNLIFRNNRISYTGTEGAYIGTSHIWNADSTLAVPIIGIQFYNNQIDHAGWDGVQFSNCWNVRYYNNTITNYGILNQSAQRAGLQFGSAVTVDTCYNNTIAEGTGTGINIFANDSIRITNTVLTNVGKATGEYGVFMDNRPQPFNLRAQQVTLENDTINGANKAAIYNYNKDRTSLQMLVHNCTLLNVPVKVVDYTGGKVWNDVVVTPPIDTVVVKPPVDTPVVIVPPVVKDDTTRITGNYTVANTSGPHLIVFTGKAAAKITLPDKPVHDFKMTIVNRGTVSLSFSKRLYFRNYKYRSSEKPGETFGVVWWTDKRPYLINQRVF